MALSLPIYTSLCAAALVLLQLTLMILVGNKRRIYTLSLGDGGYADLLMSIRRHGNLAENAALFVVTLGLVELLIGSTTAVMVLATAFVVVRIAHAVGISMGDGLNAGRAIGAFGTLLTMGITAVLLTYHVLTYQVIV